MKLNSKELRDIPQSEAEGISEHIERRPLYFIIENVYDTYNIGGLFRLADALAVSKIYLCGDTETPPNHKIQKASVGTYKIVPWEYKSTALEAIEELRKLIPVIPAEAGISGSPIGVGDDKIKIYAVEQSDSSIPYTEADYSLPLALLVGNETYGVLPETLEAVDATVEIPMWGINKSLNVIVSAAIVGYHAVKK
jgi:tRNA G18 (ribose-2'-O)-methylase SpoU